MEIVKRDGVETQSVKRPAEVLGRPVLVSVTRAVADPGKPTALFRRGKEETGVFWATPSKGEWMVGLGEAYSLSLTGTGRFKAAREACETLLSRARFEGNSEMGLQAFMGLRFDPRAKTSPEWRPFGDGLLTIPRLLYRRWADRYWVTENTVASENGTDETPVAGVEPEDVGIGASLNRREWCSSVRTALDYIGSGELEKVVLARNKRVRLAGSGTVSDSLDRLMRSDPECTLFAFRRGDSCFMGASPEQLVQVRNGVVESVCLAGSARRSGDGEEDRRLGETLVRDEKERREHGIVVNEIAEALAGLCQDARSDPSPSLLKLRRVQHLATRFRGKVGKDAHILDFVERLHPTAAVAGSPQEKALEFIRNDEGMDRGWYAGPVGWVDGSGGGEFTIAIRSGLVHDNEATLYAGAGIVSGSDPEEEYRETELKLGSMLGALEW